MVHAFSPDERCLGGVAEIHAEYANMRRKLLRAQPEVTSLCRTGAFQTLALMCASATGGESLLRRVERSSQA